MKRFGIILMMSVFAAAFVSAASSSVAWEGRAAKGNAEAFPSGGNYAQSRIFSKGEIVDVVNTSNGKSTTVVITGSTDLSGVLVLLSPTAASAIGVESGYDTTVRVSRKNDFVKENTLTSVAPVAQADPDNNPAAALPSSYSNVVTAPEPQTQPVEQLPPANQEAAPVAQASAPATSTVKEIPDPGIALATEEKRPSVSAYDYSLLPPPPKDEVAPIQQNFYVCPNCSNASKSQQLCDNCKQPLYSAQQPAVSAPPASSVAPSVVQDPSVPFPELLITQYEKGKFYVQLGVYRDMKNLKNLVSKYRGKYPVSIKASDRTPGGYEMLIGPLSQDEYRAMLDRFRREGYKDAFVKFLK